MMMNEKKVVEYGTKDDFSRMAIDFRLEFRMDILGNRLSTTIIYFRIGALQGYAIPNEFAEIFWH